MNTEAGLELMTFGLLGRHVYRMLQYRSIIEIYIKYDS